MLALLDEGRRECGACLARNSSDAPRGIRFALAGRRDYRRPKSDDVSLTLVEPKLNQTGLS